MRNVIVTGASRGLGLGIVRTLARAGFHAIGIARSVVDGSHGYPDETFVKWDLSEIDTLAALTRRIQSEYGPIYGLVNNAGIGTASILSIMPTPKIEQIIQLNVLSPIVLTKYVVNSMLAAQAGRIINISSIVASTGFPGLSVYSATKASLIGFTHSLAREVGSLGITVNAIAPGFLDTEMTRELDSKQREQIKRRSALQRMPSIGDVAAAVEFLMSDKAASITGTVMTVDAGNTA